MVQEVLQLLKPEAHKRYLDGTIGGGGHSEEILLHSGPDGRVLGLDRDEEALATARQRLATFGDRLLARRANFVEAKDILAEIGWDAVDGVVLDLGVSSYQLGSAERGFSFQLSGKLDMRMDRRQSLTADHVVNSFPIAELERILREYGEEPDARRIASVIGAERKAKAIETTAELAELVARVKRKRTRGHHPATQTFQALRIAVNQELENLEAFLQNGYELLRPKGRMVIISFHSLEDRLVKNAFRKWSRACLCPPKTPVCQCGWSRKAKLLTTKPLVPSAAELRSNPHARSAKARAVERL